MPKYNFSITVIQDNKQIEKKSNVIYTVTNKIVLHRSAFFSCFLSITFSYCEEQVLDNFSASNFFYHKLDVYTRIVTFILIRIKKEVITSLVRHNIFDLECCSQSN